MVRYALSYHQRFWLEMGYPSLHRGICFLVCHVDFEKSLCECPFLDQQFSLLLFSSIYPRMNATHFGSDASFLDLIGITPSSVRTTPAWVILPVDTPPPTKLLGYRRLLRPSPRQRQGSWASRTQTYTNIYVVNNAHYSMCCRFLVNFKESCHVQ